MDSKFVQTALKAIPSHVDEVNAHMNEKAEGADPAHVLRHLDAIVTNVGMIQDHAKQDDKKPAPVAAKPEDKKPDLTFKQSDFPDAKVIGDRLAKAAPVTASINYWRYVEWAAAAAAGGGLLYAHLHGAF